MPSGAKNCSRCDGTGFQILDQGESTRAVPCKCRQEDRKTRILHISRIPRRYSNCTLENFDQRNPSLTRARGIAERYVREFPLHEVGLLFLGPCGVGKTHLAVAILQALIQTKGVNGLFYDYRDLLKEIQGTFGSTSEGSEMGILAPVFAAELLVLDDIGARQPSAWVDEILSHIISHRYNEKRVTLLTSNYPDTATRDGGPTLEERIGTRLRSRLYEMCKIVQIDGDDYRIGARQAGYRF